MPESQEFTLKKSESWRMFDDISPRYDFLNRVLSFGLDIHWRKVLARHLPRRSGMRVLDLATGTADVLLAMFRWNPDVSCGVGIDMAERMMQIGRQKIARRHLSEKIKLQTGDAHKIGCSDHSFDVVSIAFGIRNMADHARVLREMRRVLRSGGRALILEFSLPRQTVIRFCHLAYLRLAVPVMGWILTGHYQAYKYLNQTIEDFPYGEAFCDLMKEAGFVNVKAHPLLFGVATIYQGDKREGNG